MYLGIATAASIPRMTRTAMISMRVKPLSFLKGDFFIVVTSLPVLLILCVLYFYAFFIELLCTLCANV